ncbi:hypothetical protein [Clostridium polynesiense]|uniref:hypothetical protein n=1 Tax=Clostridium polynesiense TaxID=1325933 RepID=UPI00069470CF|nr:hypothetical protein [Clostridium polynesiense]
MDKICPICNKLYEFKIPCPVCGKIMWEKGRNEEYLDDYTANMAIRSQSGCNHIFYCSRCGKMESICINNVIM